MWILSPLSPLFVYLPLLPLFFPLFLPLSLLSSLSLSPFSLLLSLPSILSLRKREGEGEREREGLFFPLTIMQSDLSHVHPRASYIQQSTKVNHEMALNENDDHCSLPPKPREQNRAQNTIDGNRYTQDVDRIVLRRIEFHQQASTRSRKTRR